MWLVGERQREIIEAYIAYVERGEGHRNQLLYSAEGAGKTVLMAMLGWIAIFLATSMGIPGALGATAPTHPRLGTLIQAMRDLGPVTSGHESAPGAWGHLHIDAGDLRTPSGHVVQFRSTKPQSGATGSPIQGWNWGLGALMDEAQDTVEQGRYEDIPARFRSGERPPLVATATAKDSPPWRTWRDSLSHNWHIRRLRYTDTPFVHDAHWEMMQAECSPREWQRRGLALDVGPERMVYTTWDRAKNLRRLPQVGAKHITAQVQARFARNVGMLIGHDPGQLQDVSTFFQFFRIPGEPEPLIWVRDEVVTPQSTTEEHIGAVLARLRDHWGIYPGSGEEQPLVRIDPYGDNDSRTDRSVYTTWQQYGFDARSAAYDAKGRGKGRVPKEPGIEMVVRLLCNANGERRLYVDVDDRGRPVAPKLVEAFELSERDADGKAETQRKNRKDMSHYPATARYALWPTERPRGMAGIRAAGVLG